MRILGTGLIAALVVMLMMLAVVSFAGGKKTYGSADAVVESVYDGDTIVVSVKDWPTVIGDRIGVRVYGVDTREMKDGGVVAKKFVQSLIPDGTKVVLSDIRRDKYFRLLARVGYNCRKSICQDLSTTLLEKKYAVPYFGDTKVKFSGEIK